MPYQVTYAKFNLHVHFPLPNSREVWHYKDANTEVIKKEIEKFNWRQQKVVIFKKTIFDILRNFIPHEAIIYDDKDPPLFNNKIETLIQALRTLHLIVFVKTVATLN